jgi:hypothetical protein
MSQLTIKSLCVFTLLATLAGAALDAVLNLDDTFLGEICDPGDVDIVQFEALGGSAARIHITATGNLLTRAILEDLTTNQILFDVTATGQRLFVSTIDLKSTGTYELRISSADGSTGLYELKTLGRISPSKTNFVDLQSVAGGGSGEVNFDALAGFRLSATIKPASSPARLDGATLDGPNGPISITPFMTSFPDLIRLQEVPLGITGLGSFTLRYDNVGATGEVKTHMRLQPTLDRKTVVEDDCN